jgi:hypothetical protein
MPGLKISSVSFSCLNHEKEGKARYTNFTPESIVFIYIKFLTLVLITDLFSGVNLIFPDPCIIV